jgi:hypothetical protein
VVALHPDRVGDHGVRWFRRWRTGILRCLTDGDDRHGQGKGNEQVSKVDFHIFTLAVLLVVNGHFYQISFW